MTTLERRGSRRFSVELAVEYHSTLKRAPLLVGNGRTVNVSSSGVLFSASTEIPPGTDVRLSMDWPALLDGKWPLQMVIHGRIIRCESDRMAVQFMEYEFRTKGSGTLSARAGKPPLPR
jgi:hypothetical protein